MNFKNPHNYSVQLYGPHRECISIRPKQVISLPHWYARYCPRYLVICSKSSKQNKGGVMSQKIDVIRNPKNHKAHDKTQHRQAMPKSINQQTKKIVGTTISNHTAIFKSSISNMSLSLSNNIGVGILSYNRIESIKRLINSIRKYTNLNETTVFVSDESTQKEVKDYLSKEPNIVFLNNHNRIGIAGNTNRLMRCLDRFRYKIILNDDVEILNSGWDSFYTKASEQTGLHHFCYRQLGIYGASKSQESFKNINGVGIKTIVEKPHGAVIYFDDIAFNKVGYFDTQFGLYGMEHVDWSGRVSLSGIQIPGFHDIQGSDNYFKIHNENSSIHDKSTHLHKAKLIYNNIKNDKNRIHIEADTESTVPSVSYVIPCRVEQNREEPIQCVINNVRSQKFPHIEIVVIEQDCNKKLSNISPAINKLAKSPSNDFNKSKAFNLGVNIASNESLILHDADMLISDDYTQKMFDLLQTYESCHIGSRVLYLDQNATQTLIGEKRLDDKGCHRIVNYYEGGSLGCRKSAYIKIGGFNEEFDGYGCVLPDNYVLTDKGYISIEDVTPEHKLYTHTNMYQDIKIKNRIYNGDVYDIYIPGRLAIKGITPEHPFLINNNGISEWKMTKDLEINDTIDSTDHFPELINDKVNIDIDKSPNKCIINSSNINELCYLIGLYLSEGVLQDKSRLRTIHFYIHKDEEHIYNKVKKIVNKINNNIKISKYIRNNSMEIVIFNSLLTKMIYNICNKHKSINKIISSEFIDNLSKLSINHLISGMVDGDANHQTGSENRFIYHTSSINLAFIFSKLLRKNDIAHSFYKRNTGGFENRNKTTFDICINGEFEHNLFTAYKHKQFIGSNSVGKSKFGKIHKINKRHYSGIVYNFEVYNDHSYVVNGLIVHNCEDCEFYERIYNNTKMYDHRTEDLIHLWHGRTNGWEACHARNKNIHKKLQSQNMSKRTQDLNKKYVDKYL